MRRGGDKSFVDDLVLGRGVVISRAATSLRSVETQPWTRRFVRTRRAIISAMVLQATSPFRRRRWQSCFFFLLFFFFFFFFCVGKPQPCLTVSDRVCLRLNAGSSPAPGFHCHVVVCEESGGFSPGCPLRLTDRSAVFVVAFSRLGKNFFKVPTRPTRGAKKSCDRAPCGARKILRSHKGHEKFYGPTRGTKKHDPTRGTKKPH